MAQPIASESAALREFIARGHQHIRLDLARSFHDAVHDRLVAGCRRGEDLENGVLWRLPELHEVFDHPAVRAALTAIVGPGYVMNPHTYCHLSRPGSPGHAWHKDSYVLDHNTRHPRPRWVMALYSPQALTDDLGPTTVIPGWQYHGELTGEVADAPGLPLVADAGTVTLLHADMWHGARPNRSDHDRFVLKFLFERRWEPVVRRTGEPAAPWHKHDLDRVPLLTMDVWRWLHGEPTRCDAGLLDHEQQLAVLLGALDSASETVRLKAAYALGRVGPPAVAPLVAAVRRDGADAERAVGVRQASDPKGINPTALPAAQALAAIGEPAASAIAALAEDPAWYVRAVAADTLGNLGPDARAARPALCRLSRDPHWWVRRNAVEALGRIGDLDGPASEALLAGLSDGDHRVRLNAAVALGKLVEPPVRAIAALQRVQACDDNRYVRYYARVALDYATSPDTVEDPTPVRAGWQIMQTVSERRLDAPANARSE